MLRKLPVESGQAKDCNRPLCEVPNYVKFGEIGHRASTQLLGCGEARGTGTSHSFPVCRDTARQPLGGVSAEKQSSKWVSRPGSHQPARRDGVSRCIGIRFESFRPAGGPTRGPAALENYVKL